jgi:hypothetical protein
MAENPITEIDQQKQALDALAATINHIANQRIQSIEKTKEITPEDFFVQNNKTRLKDIPIATSNCFTPDLIDYLDVIGSAIHTLPDGEIKEQMFCLFRMINQAIVERDSINRECEEWRNRADTVLLELLKQTWVKQTKKETGGAFGRLF